MIKQTTKVVAMAAGVALLALSAGGSVFAASPPTAPQTVGGGGGGDPTSILWQTVQGFGPLAGKTITLYYGAQNPNNISNGYGLLHIAMAHGYQGPEGGAFKDIVADPSQIGNYAAGQYEYIAGNFSPASNPLDVVTVVCYLDKNSSTGKWQVHTAFPLEVNQNIDGIQSDTFGVDITTNQYGKNVFPSWLN